MTDQNLPKTNSIASLQSQGEELKERSKTQGIQQVVHPEEQKALLAGVQAKGLRTKMDFAAQSVIKNCEPDQSQSERIENWQRAYAKQGLKFDFILDKQQKPIGIMVDDNKGSLNQRYGAGLCCTFDEMISPEQSKNMKDKGVENPSRGGLPVVFTEKTKQNMNIGSIKSDLERAESQDPELPKLAENVTKLEETKIEPDKKKSMISQAVDRVTGLQTKKIDQGQGFHHSNIPNPADINRPDYLTSPNYSYKKETHLGDFCKSFLNFMVMDRASWRQQEAMDQRGAVHGFDMSQLALAQQHKSHMAFEELQRKMLILYAKEHGINISRPEDSVVHQPSYQPSRGR